MNRIHVSLLAAAVIAMPALAHHSGAMFDATRTQTIAGKVVEFNWRNPHSSFKLEVTGADGKAVVWDVEMNTPQNLVLQGWKRTTLKKGDQVTAVVRPLRNGLPGGSFVSIKLADGTVLDGSGAGDNAGNAPSAPSAPSAP